MSFARVEHFVSNYAGCDQIYVEVFLDDREPQFVTNRGFF